MIVPARAASTLSSMARFIGHGRLAALLLLAGTAACFADAPAAKLLFDPSAPGSQALLVPSCPQLAATPGVKAGLPGFDVAIQPGNPYPTVIVKPADGTAWDLSAFGHVEALITNTGDNPITLGMSLYNSATAGQKAGFNGNSFQLGPGESKPMVVVFGYSYGKPGFALNSAQVDHLAIYCSKVEGVEGLRIDSLQAAGSPGEKPAMLPEPAKVKPAHGVILGAGIPLDAAKQLILRNGTEASAAADGQSLQINFSGGQDQSLLLRPASGLWNLNECLEVRLKIKNTGQVPVTPSVQIDSEMGATDRAAPPAPIAPGAESEIVASFVPKVSGLGVTSAPTHYWENQPGTGTQFFSNDVTGISIFSDATPGAKSLLVTSITGDVPPPENPAWLGQKPPVDGDWVKTFDDEFDGNSIDLTKWDLYRPNYWDPHTHFSKDNVIVSNGTVKLHYEKKTGFQNDDPKLKQTDYADGNLETFGKWTQRYGYFEARLKKPPIGGLWPAFWLFPDRGIGVTGNDRETTRNGGMEFDIMEFLSSWGLYRHDVAFHWNDYGKDHTQLFNNCIYHNLDKDGYLTSGLLWLPGLMVIYDNGREVYRWESPLVGNQPEYIILNMVQGGFNHFNEPLDDAQLPQDFTIDYVRVWQRKDLASPVDGPKPNQGTLDAPK